MKFISNFLVSIDQLGNVLAGGNPDNTISARVGYYTEEYYKNTATPAQWTKFKELINFAFYPIDGEEHCKEAYFNDAGEEFDKGTSDIAIAMLAILIVPVCLVVAVLLHLLKALGIVSPKTIDRSKNIKERLRIADARLKGVFRELNTHTVEIDEELHEILKVTERRIEAIAIEIYSGLYPNQRPKTIKLGKKADNIRKIV